MSSLKPCPFCGELAVGKTNDFGSWFEHPLGSCPAGDAVIYFIDVENWNRRPVEEALLAALLKAKEIIHSEFCGNSGDHLTCRECFCEDIESAIAKAKGAQ